MIAIDMEMPKGCEDCPFVDEYGECLLLPGCQKLEWGRRLPNCPLRELVRCKDCKHYFIVNQPYDEPWCSVMEDSVPTDGYCYHGRRREVTE